MQSRRLAFENMQHSVILSIPGAQLLQVRLGVSRPVLGVHRTGTFIRTRTMQLPYLLVVCMHACTVGTVHAPHSSKSTVPIQHLHTPFPQRRNATIPHVQVAHQQQSLLASGDFTVCLDASGVSAQVGATQWPLNKDLPVLKAALTIFSFGVPHSQGRDVYYILVLPHGEHFKRLSDLTRALPVFVLNSFQAE